MIPLILTVFSFFPAVVLATDAHSGASPAAGPATNIAHCEACHGAAGASARPEIPIIGGMSAGYLKNALWAYQDGAWPCPPIRYPAGKMSQTNHCAIARTLDTAQIESVTAHFASQAFVPAVQTLTSSPSARGRELHQAHCEKCHTQGGANAADDAGLLAGQWYPALRSILADYQSGKRAQLKAMRVRIEPLSDADLDALAAYYASSTP